MTPIIAGYAFDSALASIDSKDANRLTHIFVAFGILVDGKVSVKHLNLDHMKKIREYNSNIKLLLSIGGWGAGGFSEASSTSERRRILAQSISDTVLEYNFDGADIDWEYPCYGVAGIKASPRDKYNFTLLLQETRGALDKAELTKGCHLLLTIAAGADAYYAHGTQMHRVQEFLDWVQLMTYDMRGGFQTLTGHHTNLYTPTGDLIRISIQSSVEMFVKEGVPAEKIVIGAAFYSRMWKNVPNQNNGLLQLSSGTGGPGPVYHELKSSYINKNGYRRYWDNEAKAPYLFNGSSFISYDDEESLAYKCKYIRDNQLAGIMYWQHGCDNTKTLLKALDSYLY